MWRFFFAGVTAAVLTGCATPARQTEDFFARPRVLPDVARVEGVPFYQQEAGQCGPATLAMAMNWAGEPVSVEQLVPQVYTPKMKGTLQSDLVTASRRHGLMAVPITGLEALLTEIAAGNPVIVFENLGLSWVPQWHYAIVYGYDLNARTVTMHSGPDQEMKSGIKRFERDWEYSDHWGLVVLPAGRLSATAGEFTQAAAAAGLEQAGQFDAAEKSYAKVLDRWPVSLIALFGSANLAVHNSNFSRAAGFLERATRAHPESSIAWHNLAIVQGKLKQLKKARVSALKAIELASPQVKNSYNENLKVWLSGSN